MAAGRLPALRINARELLRQPGLEKRVDVTVPAAELGVDDERVTGHVAVDLTATSTVDGVTVRGTVAVPWQTVCRRCLTELSGVAVASVDEVYHDGAPAGDDAFELVGDQIDVAAAVREHVLLELPDDVLCREACQGICPVCGTDRNTASCGCGTDVRDERWAALDEFRPDDEPPSDDAG